MNQAVEADTILKVTALAVARNRVGAKLPIADVMRAEGMTEADYETFTGNPTFNTYVAAYVKELTEAGFGFSAKCRVLAEDLLPTAYHMSMDNGVSPAVRAKLIENIVEWGGLRPKNTTATVEKSGPGFSITINLPGQTPETPTEAPIDVVPEPQISSETTETALVPATTTEKATLVVFDESEEYEYAGDDVLEAPQ